MGRKGKPNLAMEEAEVTKIEELNKRRKKALEDQAELVRQEQDLEAARHGEEDPAPEVMPISENLASIIDGLDDDGKFWVYRLNDRGQSAMVGNYPLSEWPDRLEEIARKAGGGTFRISFRNARGHPIKQVTQTYDEKFYAEKEKERDPAGGLMAVLAEMQKNTAAVLESGRRDMMDMMKTLVTVMGGKQSGPDYKDIAMLGEIFAKGKGGGDAVDVLKTGIELGMKMAEGKEPSSTLDRVLETIAAPAAGLLSKLAENPPVLGRPKASPARPAAAPKPLPEPPAPPAPVMVEAPVDPIKVHPFYTTYVPKVLEAAKKKEDPAEWAEYVLDMIPALYHPKLLELIQKPDLVEYLGSYEPDARNCAVWIVTVRDAILKQFDPEEIPPAKGGVFSTPAPAGAEIPEALAQAMTDV